jgi:glutaconate CoA-transferase, subunit A
VPTAELVAGGPVQSLLLNRVMVDGVVETPRGAHFTSCVPDYGRDELFQRRYVKSAVSDQAWSEFRSRFLDGDEAEYLAQVDALAGAVQ